MSKLKSLWTCKVCQVTHCSAELSPRRGECARLPVPQQQCCPCSPGQGDRAASRDEDHPYCCSRMSVRGAEPANPFASRLPAAMQTSAGCWGPYRSGVFLHAMCQLCQQHCCLLWHCEFQSGVWPFRLFVLFSVFSHLNLLGPFPSLLDCCKRKWYDQTGVVCVLNSWHMHEGSCLLEPADEADKWPVWESIEHSIDLKKTSTQILNCECYGTSA